MAGMDTPVRATAVATPNSAEGLILAIVGTGEDIMNPTTASVPSTPGNANNAISGVMNITPGATTTAIVVRCRRGNGVAGTQVGTSQTHTLAAAASGNVPFMFTDPNAPIDCGYSITVAQTGGTGAGTVNEIVAQVGNFI